MIKNKVFEKTVKSIGYGVAMGAATTVKMYADVVCVVVDTAFDGTAMMINGVKEIIKDEKKTNVVEDILELYGVKRSGEDDDEIKDVRDLYDEKPEEVEVIG